LASSAFGHDEKQKESIWGDWVHSVHIVVLFLFLLLLLMVIWTTSVHIVCSRLWVAAFASLTGV